MKDYSVFCNGFYDFLYVLGLFSAVGLQGLQVSAEEVGMGNQPLQPCGQGQQSGPV